MEEEWERVSLPIFTWSSRSGRNGGGYAGVAEAQSSYHFLAYVLVFVSFNTRRPFLYLSEVAFDEREEREQNDIIRVLRSPLRTHKDLI